jgi:hypothetical protein
MVSSHVSGDQLHELVDPSIDTTPDVIDAVALARLYGEPLFSLPNDLYIPPDALEVFLETFQGPLDLLLYLIRKQNFNVLDIPMAEVTRQYLSYVDQIRMHNLELAAVTGPLCGQSQGRLEPRNDPAFLKKSAQQVDQHIAAFYRARQLPVPEVTDDATFLRRAFLVSAGRIPTAEEARDAARLLQDSPAGLRVGVGTVRLPSSKKRCPSVVTLMPYV